MGTAFTGPLHFGWNSNRTSSPSRSYENHTLPGKHAQKFHPRGNSSPYSSPRFLTESQQLEGRTGRGDGSGRTELRRHQVGAQGHQAGVYLLRCCSRTKPLLQRSSPPVLPHFLHHVSLNATLAKKERLVSMRKLKLQVAK